MFTKNIFFKNFNSNLHLKYKNKNLSIFNKKNLFSKYPLLKTFSKDFKYSYSKNLVNKYKKSSTFKVIGMGGSILGTEAIYYFLKNKIKKKFYFVDNLNPKLTSKNKSVNIIVSKSGETLETISNFHALERIEKNNKNIFITENNHSYIQNLANKLKADIVEHKNYVGGRYSVLSEVGMLPSELMGLNERKFKRLNYLIKNKHFLKNLVQNVSSTVKLISKGKINSIILNYDDKSDHLFKWYQQLIAESLGKKSKGIIPIISSMPKDNHSLLQLYLDGPKNCFFTFFSMTEKHSSNLNPKNIFKSKIYLKNKNLYKIVSAQKKATETIFTKKKIPFRVITGLKRSEETLGELFCFFVLETILLGNALKVDPFDQPSVELIKIQTKRYLI